MTNSRPNQVQRVLMYVERHGSITQREADRYISVTRLPSRINEMKKNGYIVNYTWKTVRNKYGETCRVKRYTIEKGSSVQ